jgi:monoamine oxidase
MARGTYSYQTAESIKLDVISKLSEPAMDNNLFFAGEARHPRYYSTVHGAIESGCRASNEIITILKSN